MPPCKDMDDLTIDLRSANDIPGETCRILPPCPVTSDFEIDLRSQNFEPGVNCRQSRLLNDDFQIALDELPDFDPETFTDFLEVDRADLQVLDDLPAPLTTPSTPILQKVFILEPQIIKTCKYDLF